MPIAEIEYPLAGAIVGPTFDAGGIYDLTTAMRMPRGPAPQPPFFAAPVPATNPTIIVRCKLLDSASVAVAQSDFEIPTDALGNPVLTGSWYVQFNVSGTYPNGKLSSYLVDADGSEHDGEMVVDINVNVNNDPMSGGDIAVQVEDVP